mgnify:CR=1 FL=1
MLSLRSNVYFQCRFPPAIHIYTYIISWASTDTSALDMIINCIRLLLYLLLYVGPRMLSRRIMDTLSLGGPGVFQGFIPFEFRSELSSHNASTASCTLSIPEFILCIYHRRHVPFM